MSKTFLFRTIQFSISTPIDRTLSGATSLRQNGPGGDSNEGLLRIPQSSINPGTSLSDCFVSYPGHSLGESYLSAEKQSAYSTAQIDSVIILLTQLIHLLKVK